MQFVKVVVAQLRRSATGINSLPSIKNLWSFALWTKATHPDRYILMKTTLIKTAIDVESARSSQAKTNLLALCENGMAIPEHSDLVQEILKQTTIKAEADENVRVLEELLLE